MRWFICLFLCLMPICSQGQEPSYNYFKAHPDECPKRVTLKSSTEFKLFLNGKEVGTATIPAGTQVEFIQVANSGIEVSAGNGKTAILSFDQTDFLELWRGIRAERREKASMEPVFSLQLPPCSMPLDWYKKQLEESINPWLLKNADHELAPKIKALKESFEKELAQTTKGEIRIGSNWIIESEADEWVEDLKARDVYFECLKFKSKPDATTFIEFLQKMPDISRTELYPFIIRMINELIPELQNAVPSGDEAKAKYESQIKELNQKIESLTSELKEALNFPTGHTSPQGNDLKKPWEDGRYRPAGRYVTAHHYAELAPYYPDPTDYYKDYTPEQYEEYKKKALMIEDYKQQIRSIQENIEQIAKKVREQKETLSQVTVKFATSIADQNETILEDIKKSKDLSPNQVQTLFINANKVWPRNTATARACYDKVESMLAECENLLNQGKITEAKDVQNVAYNIFTTSQIRWKRSDILFKKSRDLKSKITQEERKKRPTS